MSKKKIAIIIGLLLLAILLVASHHPRSHSNPVDTNEPEGDILSIVRFSGDTKLTVLLAAPQVSAAKAEMSTYIHTNIGSRVYLAVIENTVLQSDGGISLKVLAGGKTFAPLIYSNDSQFIFKVPAVNYQTSTPQSVVQNQYSGVD